MSVDPSAISRGRRSSSLRRPSRSYGGTSALTREASQTTERISNEIAGEECKESSYRIVEQLLDPRVDIFALFLSYQQVNVLDARTRAQQLIDQDFSHEALKSETFSHTKFIGDYANSPVPPVMNMLTPS